MRPFRDINKTAYQLPFKFNSKLYNCSIERYNIIEVTWGNHQIVEISASEMLRKLRDLVNCRVGGEITHNDIKQIFSDISNSVPSIEIRKNCVLVSFNPIIAIVMYDRAIIKVTDSIDIDTIIINLKNLTKTLDNEIDVVVEYYKKQINLNNQKCSTSNSQSKQIKNTDSNSNLSVNREMLFSNSDTSDKGKNPIPPLVDFPLEYRILEYLINYVYDYIGKELEKWETKMRNLEIFIKKKYLQQDHLYNLYDYKAPIQNLRTFLEGINNAIDELLNSDEKMFALQLTKIHFMPEQASEFYNALINNNTDKLIDKEEVNQNFEVLFEHLSQEAETLLATLLYLEKRLINLESLIQNKINLSRNIYQLWEVGCTLATVALALSSSISGIFGMNLVSGFEDNNKMFYCVTTLIIIIFIVSLFGLFSFKRFFAL